MNDAHVTWMPDLICSGQNWDQLPGVSRVWIYLADRMLSKQEQVELGDELEAFVQQWSAHGTLLQASWQLLGGRALAIGLDEGHALGLLGRHGCLHLLYYRFLFAGCGSTWAIQSHSRGFGNDSNPLRNVPAGFR